ncbi:hypothetical protein V8E55_010062 [Tylopilus felleus]
MPAPNLNISSAPPSTSRHRLPRDASMFPAPLKVRLYATPSIPWHFMYPDMDTISPHLPCSRIIPGVMEDWKFYPQNLFPDDWTPDRVEKSGLLPAYDHTELCTVHELDMSVDGENKQYSTTHTNGDEELMSTCWSWLQAPRPACVRAIFVENMTSQVMQMLGTRYEVEPSFFLSSVNSIPSNYQDDPKLPEGDHITIILPFIRTMKTRQSVEREGAIMMGVPLEEPQGAIQDERPLRAVDAPLTLRDGLAVVQDLLAIHMVRTTTTSTIISYHPRSMTHGMSAQRLQSALQIICNSAYWSQMHSILKDPTFVLIAILKYVLQAWDEAFKALYARINELVNNTTPFTYSQLSHFLQENDGSWNNESIQELHELQTRVMYYPILLRNFRDSVVFLGETPNPAMSVESIRPQERRFSMDLLRHEVDYLHSEVDRLQGLRSTLIDRLRSAMARSYDIANIESRRTFALGVMRLSTSGRSERPGIQIVLIVFLPPYVLSCVFRMNVREFKPGATLTLAQYIEATITLICFCLWFTIALQEHSLFHPGGHIVRRLIWPIYYVWGVCIKIYRSATGSSRRRGHHYYY